MSLADILSDVSSFQKRAQKLHAAGTLDPKFELVNNVYPLLVKLVGAAASKDELESLAAEFDEFVENEGSVIQPELAQRIYVLAAASQALVDAVRELKLDDVTRKKLLTLCTQVEQLSAGVVNEVQEAEIELEGGEADDEDEDALQNIAGEDDTEGEGEPDVESDEKPAGV